MGFPVRHTADDLPLLTCLWSVGHEVSCGTGEIDQIMIRDGAAIRLEALEWSFGARFVTSSGEASLWGEAGPRPWGRGLALDAGGRYRIGSW